MLYDKRWERTETKPDVFSLESLIAWLETMPADGSYDWGNCDGMCLIGLYGAAQGISWDDLLRKDKDGHSGYRKLVGADRSVAVYAPWTFGAALERARAAL